MRVFGALAWVLMVACAAVAARGQGLAPRQDVTFEVTQTTAFGQSVFVTGTLPELGNDSSVNAIKMSAAAYPTWRVTVSLPAGRTYSYRFMTRNDGPGQQGTFGATFAGPFAGSTAQQPRVGAAGGSAGKALWLTWNVEKPIMWWRPASPTSGGAFVARPMEYYGPAVSGRANEKQWHTWGFHTGGEAIDFYFTAPDGSARYPASGNYSTNLDGVFVQEGQLYSYVPAAAPAAARRDYNPASPPALFSTQLNQWRNYRVYLPRGYDQHPERRYPVIYIHDGQNIFDQGSFGTWNADDTLAALQANGQMQEVIAVGIDNIGETRRSDYSAPGDNNGRADQYVGWIVGNLKPHIDGGYRTLTDANNTAALGSSMGGVVSLYMGYDWNANFKRVGCLSTAWWLIGNYTNYIRNQPARSDLRIYMDVGDSGSTSGGNNFDGYWDSLGIRDNFVGGTSPKYTLDGRYKFVIGYGQNHSEGSWAFRLPGALTFLFPGQGEPNTLLRTMLSPTWDANSDGLMTLEDLCLQGEQPRDLNFDGVIEDGDSAGLERYLRRDEALGMKGR